ncbi:hypothetical protein [Couchioplanes caeruleus]|uniref:hypothetical protein n=1 Tax=Couchioplanes caeruleus TaxID=56438 RepID=UPI0023DEF8AA|nr:hypothetical protein [Couchioplanes caeruleus]
MRARTAKYDNPNRLKTEVNKVTEEPFYNTSIYSFADLLVDADAAIQSPITETLADRTTFVIAHRLATVRVADPILVMHRIAERGTHPDLLARGGRYAPLYRTQFHDRPVSLNSARPPRRGPPT